MYFELRNPWVPDLDDLVPCLWPVQEKAKIALKLAVAVPTWSVEFVKRTFKNKYYRHVPGNAGHTILLVAKNSFDGSRWHVRVVIHGALWQDVPGKERKRVVEELCRAIDYGTLPLLRDTITELYIGLDKDAADDDAVTKLIHSPLPANNAFNPTLQDVWVHTYEDPYRVRFPQYIGLPTTRRIHMSEISRVEELYYTAFTVRVASEGDQLFLLKQIDRPMYMPQDTPALLEEFKVLEQVGGQGNIVRLVAAVVSGNPYRTAAIPDPEEPPLLHGLLLEYHPGGTLEDMLKSPEKVAGGMNWCKWGVQLCTAVATLHQHGLAHLDIKPANAVISKDNDLVLIDVGGIGGTTPDWVSPSIDAWHAKCELADIPLAIRQENDVWGAGKILVQMGRVSIADLSCQVLLAQGTIALADPSSANLSDLAAIILHKSFPL